MIGILYERNKHLWKNREIYLQNKKRELRTTNIFTVGSQRICLWQFMLFVKKIQIYVIWASSALGVNGIGGKRREIQEENERDRRGEKEEKRGREKERGRDREKGRKRKIDRDKWSER